MYRVLCLEHVRARGPLEITDLIGFCCKIYNRDNRFICTDYHPCGSKHLKTRLFTIENQLSKFLLTRTKKIFFFSKKKLFVEQKIFRTKKIFSKKKIKKVFDFYTSHFLVENHVETTDFIGNIGFLSENQLRNPVFTRCVCSMFCLSREMIMSNRVTKHIYYSQP